MGTAWAMGTLPKAVSGGAIRLYEGCKADKSVEIFFVQESILRNPRIVQLLCCAILGLRKTNKALFYVLQS